MIATVTRKLSVSLCVFRAPLQQEVAMEDESTEMEDGVAKVDLYSSDQ
jgi:hypothetical protein